MTRCGVYLSEVGMLPFRGCAWVAFAVVPGVALFHRRFVVRAAEWACTREYVIGRNIEAVAGYGFCMCCKCSGLQA